MKRSLVVGNWKMYATELADAHLLATTFRNELSSCLNIEAVICPPAVWLIEVAHILKKGRVKLGAQNLSSEAEGAYTGEISALMLKGLADYVIVGHSERREYFGETDFDINEKLILALRAGLTPILCVGERKHTSHPTEPLKQLEAALDGVPKKYLKDIAVAYEPVWAIGTGKNAEPEYVARVATLLREHLHLDTPILYGGSINSKNVTVYAKRPEIDGVLVGGASVRSSEFIKICKIWNESNSLHK